MMAFNPAVVRFCMPPVLYLKSGTPDRNNLQGPSRCDPEFEKQRADPTGYPKKITKTEAPVFLF
jgi:hypothetical protein